MKNNTEESQLKKKLQQIAMRSKLKSAASIFYQSSIALFCIYFSLLILCRLFSIIPDFFNLLTTLIPFAIAAIISVLFHKTPANSVCAKLADKTHNKKDLFSTAASIEHAYGEFSPIVLKNAEEQSHNIDPKKVVNINFSRQIRNLIILLLLVAAASFFLPHFDLLGKDRAKQKEKENKQTLAKSVKSVKERINILQKKSTSKNSPEVEKILADIKDQFKSMKKSQKAANQEKLRQIQHNLSQIWNKRQKEKLRDQLQTNLQKQSFGMLDKKEQTWQKELHKNNFNSLKKEIEDIKKLAQKISEMSDSKEKKSMQKELDKKMKKLSDFMASQLGSKSAQAALNDAIKQFKMSNLQGLNKDAMNAMQDSMQLLKRELDHLNQMTNDISQLEMAMEAAQLAKQLNQLGKMQNAEQGGVESIEDYADFYKKMMSASKQGNNKGKPGDPVGGEGAPPKENKDAETATKKEVSKSQLQPGKILMKWNTKGMGKTGKAKEEYLNSVEEVKQSVSEAILREQIPPGYHKSIQKYFDNLEK